MMAGPAMMALDEFWRIIEVAGRSTESGDGEPPVPWENLPGLAAALRTLAPVDITQFKLRYSDCMNAAYHWDVWGALWVIEGGGGGDTFEHFRAELVMLGRERFQSVLENPDSLADLESPPVGIEGLIYVPARVYEELTGSPFPNEQVFDANPLPEAPAGAPWEEGDLPSRFPRLWGRFGGP